MSVSPATVAPSATSSSSSQRRVLLTGAHSALGRAVVAALVAQGYSVRAVDEQAPGISGDRSPLPVGPAIEVQRGDLTDPAFCATLVRDITAIVHLAPLSLPERMPGDAPGELLDAVTRGTHVLLKAAIQTGVSAVVQGSTLAVMDAYDESYAVDELWRPRPTPDPWLLAPYLAELATREFTRDHTIESPPEAICLRFARLGSEVGADADALPLTEAANAVLLALARLQESGRQRGHRWQLYHLAGAKSQDRFPSTAAIQELGYAPAE